jgi:dienelactone hydrolase
MIAAAVLLAAAAQSPPPPETARAALGAITPRIACAGDPRYSYALYLPKDYDPARPWPVLFVFDPRGRGAEAAEIFLDAARAHGLVIASSNDTRSDDPAAPNAEAVTAVWSDAHARIAVDPARRYAAGFSGTGRLAVRLGMTRPGNLAGVIAAGSRLVADSGKNPWPFAFFGAAGDTDFNHPEVWRLDARLAANGTPHRTVEFDGGHEWLPAALALEAFDWLALAGRGARPADSEVIARHRAAITARARALEAAGRVGEALRAWEVVREDLTAAGRKDGDWGLFERLGDAAVRDLERVRKQVERDADWIHEANRRIAVLAGDPPPPVARLRRDFEVEALQKQAASADPVLSRSAARRLNAVATNAGFYLGERFRAEGRLLNAARAYELAIAIDPSRPGAHLGQARVLARTGNRKGALDALREAVARGLRLPRARVAEDPELSSLAGDPEFTEILKVLPD